MSESIKLIYRVLNILEKSMDYSEIDVDRLSPEALRANLNRRNAILEMLLKKGYISFQRGLFQTL
ncbi:YjcQ family protein [Absicoccus intestinalis]|uniref:YjcQ family protein n=1 Tax=Absicoccus intestinalis TaxID=2926319 RepID=UPI00351D7F63